MDNSFMSRRLVDLGLATGLLFAWLIVFGVEWLLPPPVAPPVSLGPGNDAPGRSLLQPKTLYALREVEDKEVLAEEYGIKEITPESEGAVKAGLDWLARHQAKDGSWCSRHLTSGPQGVCEPEGRCGGAGGNYAAAQTGLAVLAFQAAGHYEFNKREYSQNVRDGLDWLVKQQRPDGGVYAQEGRTYMYEHGMATFALAESCAVARAAKRPPDRRHLKAAKAAVGFIESQQHDDGGWRYTGERYSPSDSSVSGWQVLALKSAREAEIPVSEACIENVRKFFQGCETGQDGRTGYQARNVMTEATTGVGMLVHQFLLDGPQSELVLGASPYLAQMAENSWGDNRSPQPDYYLLYNCTLAMHTAGGPNWERWNDVVQDFVISRQESKEAGCARGSWAPSSRWGSEGGRVYTTALAVLTLEVYYRFAKVEKP